MEVPGYRVTGVIGRGGSAEALSAVDGSGRRVVLKLFHAAGDPRAEREAAALARLGAPVAPALFAAGQLADGRPWLAMEEVVGEEPSASLAVEWIAAAAATLDAMQAAG
ncbi:MAG TPA: phosphotransferase, partial [Kofleriaceae bacterium]